MPGRFRQPSDKVAWTIAIVAAIVLCFVTLGPATIRPHSSLAGPIENFVAYAVPAGIIIAFIRNRRALVVAVIAMIVFAGVLEAAQLYTPDRHGTLHDFAAKAAGVIVGALAAMILRRVMFERRTDRPADDAGDWLR